MMDSSALKCVAPCIFGSNKEAWLEKQCAALALENERLHQKLREQKEPAEPRSFA